MAQGVRFLLDDEARLLPLVTCTSLGRDWRITLQLHSFWDKVALTEHANRAVKAMSLVYGDVVEGVNVIGGDDGIYFEGRRPIVKMENQDRQSR